MSVAVINVFWRSLMRVFLTGASGFIGSAILDDLLAAGHDVDGLVRSDAAAEQVAAAGGRPRRGDLQDLDGLGEAAAAADGVIHTAFVHDFSNIAASGPIDLRAVETIGAALAGSDRPFVMTTGTGLLAPGRVATERDASPADGAASHRAPSERAALALADSGVRSSVVRPAPTVHGQGDHGFLPMMIDAARATGVSGYVGDGANRWPAVHRFDAARLYRLALESGPAGSVLHATAEDGIPMREIAEAIGRGLGVPARSVTVEQAAEAMPPFLAAFISFDIPASSELTRELVGWQPAHPGLIEDLEQGHYFEQAALSSP
jgi:nucleoside-diphosphate-sugar epimerase